MNSFRLGFENLEREESLTPKAKSARVDPNALPEELKEFNIETYVREKVAPVL